MKERVVNRNGEHVIEVRSDGGKLLFIKTKLGYEIKCSRTKQICLVKYEEMLGDCFESMDALKDCLRLLEENYKRVDALFRKKKSVDK